MKQEINELGINYDIITMDHIKVCPQCSTTRKKKFDTCLSVTIEDDFVVFIVNCNFSGKRYFLKVKGIRKLDLQHKERLTIQQLNGFQEEE